MRGLAPAVIGVLTVSLVRLSPAAVPDPLAVLILVGDVAATLLLQTGAFKVIIGGAALGVPRSRRPLTVLTRRFCEGVSRVVPRRRGKRRPGREIRGERAGQCPQERDDLRGFSVRESHSELDTRHHPYRLCEGRH